MSEATATKHRRMRWSAEERVDWVEMLAKSGKPLREFCRENGLPPASLSLWRQRLRGAEPADEQGALVQVPTQLKSEVPAVNTVLTVRLPCGIELEVPVGTDAQWFAGILRALRRMLEP